ncbi:MAG: hypothetical protein HFG33_03735 [Bacilli bacterium]|nr:hypothetical protein [Bacilli bacterium]
MKNIVTIKVLKNMVFSSILLMPLQISMGACPEFGLIPTKDEIKIVDDEVPPSAMPMVVLLDVKEKSCDIECFLENKNQEIEFLSKTFAIKSSEVHSRLEKINDDGLYDELNIGRLKNNKGKQKKYSSFEEGLIEYLFSLEKKESKLFSKKRIPYTGKAKYVEDLIKYFTDIYDNVDYLTAVSIGAAESGYYKVTYMLRCNNVFGGMGSNGLLKYRNMEYGILSYIRLLSKSYYGKGLKTVESIGRVYCPTIDENGKKVASSHWVNLVKTAKSKYKNNNSDREITVDKLLND